MLIDDSLFQNASAKLNRGTVNPTNYVYEAKFLDADKKVIPVHNVTSLSILSNYTTSSSDYVFATLQVFKSSHQRLLSANRKQLLLELTKKLGSVTGSEVQSSQSKTVQYDAYLTENRSEAIETRSGGLDGTHTDDLGELVTIHVQLVERGLSEFRLWDIGGVYRNVSPEKLLQALLSHPIKALDKSGKKGYHVTIAKPDNVKLFYQVLIQNGVRLIDLPSYIQKKYGVYSSGIGYYLQKGMWYVFPQFDVKRYNQSIKRMTIVNVPVNEMMGSHNTYYLEGDELYVYATGNTKHIDEADYNLDRTGTGIRAAKAGNLMGKYSQSAEGDTKVPKDRNVVTVSFDHREGELSNIQAAKGLVTSNVWEDASKVISGMINKVVVKWEYSNPDLLYPGMPVKFLYKDRGKPYSLLGVVGAIETHVETPQNSVTDLRYISMSQLTLHVERASR